MELTALETTFYTLGIIFMALILLLLISLVLIVLYIKHRINMIQKAIDTKIDEIKKNPQEAAIDIGANIVSKFFSRKRK